MLQLQHKLSKKAEADLEALELKRKAWALFRP